MVNKAEEKTGPRATNEQWTEAKLAELYVQCRRPFIATLRKKFQLDEATTTEHYMLCFSLFLEKIALGQLPDLTDSVQNYLIGIGKNKWLEMQRRQQKMETAAAAWFFDSHENEDPEKHRLVKAQQLAASYQKLSPHCQQILRLFYYEGATIAEITEKLDYTSKASARNQKYKCLKKLKEIVQ